MAQLAIDDYEIGPNGSEHPVYLAIASAGCVYSSTASHKKDGSYGLHINTSTGYALYSITSSTEIFMSVFLVPNGANTGKQIVWRRDGVELGSLRWDGTFYSIHVGTDGTPEATGTTVVPALSGGGAMKNYQLRMKIGNTTTGSIQFKLEGVMEAQYDAQDTQPGSETTINEVMLCNQIHVDNLYINDTTTSQNNTWPGVVRFYTDRPITDSAEPSHNQWTGSEAGTKANLVNGALGYIYSDVAGQRQGFTYPTPGVPTNSTIKSINTVELPYKLSSARIKQGIRVGTGNYDGSTHNLNTGIFSGSARVSSWGVNPANGLPWTTTDNPETYVEHVAE